MFFKSKSNLPLAEKAKVEFHMQQLAECIGFDRFKLPIQDYRALIELGQSGQTAAQITRVIGEHLFHDVSELNVDIEIEAVETCGGGG